MADAVGGVVGGEGRTDPAAVPDQVVAGPAETLSVGPDLVGVAGRSAESQVLEVAGLADAGLGNWVVVGVDGADVAATVSQLVVLGQADAGLSAEVVDAFGVAGHAADAQTLVVHLVPGALTAHSVDRVVVGDAAAYTVVQHSVHSASNHAVALSVLAVSGGADAGTCLSVVGRVALALGADSVDAVVGGCAVTLVLDDVEAFVDETDDVADAQVGIEHLVVRTHHTHSSNQVVVGLADAVGELVVGVGVGAGGGRHGQRHWSLGRVGSGHAVA